MRSNSLAAPSFDTGNRFVNDNRVMPRLRVVLRDEKPRLENFLQLPHVRAYAKSTQPQSAPRKITVAYDQLAREQKVYAYVNGNPISGNDPSGEQLFRYLIKGAPYVLAVPVLMNIIEQYWSNRSSGLPPETQPDPPPNSCSLPADPWGHYSSAPQFYLQSPVPQKYNMPEDVPELDMPPEQNVE